jgi:hypothetical protein
MRMPIRDIGFLPIYVSSMKCWKQPERMGVTRVTQVTRVAFTEPMRSRRGAVMGVPAKASTVQRLFVPPAAGDSAGWY